MRSTRFSTPPRFIFSSNWARRSIELEAEVGRHLVVIAESDLNQPRVVTPREAGGYGLDAQWNDDFHHALHTILTGETAGYLADFGSIAQLAKCLTRGFVYDGTYSRSRRRRHGRPVIGLSAHRFVAFMQNHDQVGNRAMGERLGHLVTIDQLKISAALLMTSPFIPMLFQGEEWNASSPFQYFTDHQDAALAESVRNGRRAEFAHFVAERRMFPIRRHWRRSSDRSSTGTSASADEHREIFEWYRQLIGLRRCVRDFENGRARPGRGKFRRSSALDKRQPRRVSRDLQLRDNSAAHTDCARCESLARRARVQTRRSSRRPRDRAAAGFRRDPDAERWRSWTGGFK